MAGPEKRSDEALMVAFQQGDAEAFAELVRRHQRPVMSFLFRFTGSRDRAEDLFQEVFLRVVRSARSFRQESRFTTWLYRIARNLCIDQHRRNGLVSMVSTETPVGQGKDGEAGQTLGEKLADEAPSPEVTVGRSKLAGRLERAIDALPPDQREVFVMREVLDMPFGEIAEVTGTPENTVKSRMRYALEGLRRQLKAARVTAVEEALS